MADLSRAVGDGPVLITGGAGFVGCNVADRLLRAGREVVVLDNLSRAGVDRNLAWLRATHGDRVRAIVADVRDGDAVVRAARDAAAVFHFAAQVAVTTSLVDPVDDFEVNARGTLNLLEALRERSDPPPLLFTSTNKVYGDLADVAIGIDGRRYGPVDADVAAYGVGEARRLDFHSPYGCSKGTADQYVLDYARSYGLRAVVFRMSCIYGPHQFGTEDQGWVAHFLIRAIEGRPIVLYGDGMQVRDVLYVDDLVDAMLRAVGHVDELAGRAFNIGGGPANTTSLVELVERIAVLRGEAPSVTFDEWRTGDQRYYVSDVRAFAAATGWTPRTGVADGVERLYAWLVESRAGAPALHAGAAA
ncbi:NAD-dependent epimerase/dehydratase family protein [Roseisolibacter agri]|uniref:NAD-dependent epimerase/dehydratase family protein n=1 Tax=Roseisolibacter agri TaxID=2014610 RepID=UPI0024E15844|nr:NAD-dependent epimerase/dehydratase family protein [Roseisolibacter agri]